MAKNGSFLTWIFILSLALSKWSPIILWAGCHMAKRAHFPFICLIVLVTEQLKSGWRYASQSIVWDTLLFLRLKDILFTDRLKTVTPGSTKYTIEPNYKEMVLIHNV